MNMSKTIRIIYKGGISKSTGRREERLDYEANLSLDAVLEKMFKVVVKHKRNIEKQKIFRGYKW